MMKNLDPDPAHQKCSNNHISQITLEFSSIARPHSSGLLLRIVILIPWQGDHQQWIVERSGHIASSVCPLLFSLYF